MEHRSNYPSTAEMQALDAAHNLHPFTDTGALNKKGARIITSANGVYIHDSEGQKILDGMAGLWCVNLGYGRKEMAEVAYRQSMELPFYNTFFQTSHPPALLLAAKLAEVMPGDLNRVFYSGSGSEANDTNIRLVRHFWASQGKPEKNHIIARWNGYHGSTMGGGSLGGMKGIHAQGGLPIPGISHIDQPYWYGEGGDSTPEEFGIQRARALETEIERLGADKVAAFIAEPIQGAGGVIIPPSTYWPEIQRICREHDVLLIADEVITAFGRTGQWFGSQTFDIQPDIMTIAKGLSSGYAPIGGSMVSERVCKILDDVGGEFAHGYTYNGHPVSAAVALENLRIMQEEKIVETAAGDTMPYMAKRWAELADHPMVGEARIEGFMGAIELTPDKSARAPFAGNEGDVGYMVRERCFANGLVMRHVGDKMIISPPLIITRSEIDHFLELAVQALDEGMKQAKDAGLFKAGKREN